mmetsp:Transcript_100554/g.138672  ORF Transcript_100554/g.138672 Transcript_100554/m.138672 type:complete len:89 (-) Transcript_100554:748-1014(-)
MSDCADPAMRKSAVRRLHNRDEKMFATIDKIMCMLLVMLHLRGEIGHDGARRHTTMAAHAWVCSIGRGLRMEDCIERFVQQVTTSDQL